MVRPVKKKLLLQCSWIFTSLRQHKHAAEGSVGQLHLFLRQVALTEE